MKGLFYFTLNINCMNKNKNDAVKYKMYSNTFKSLKNKLFVYVN